VLTWKGPNFINVEAPIGNDAVFDAAGPLIIFQRTPLSQMLQSTEYVPALIEEAAGEKVEFTAEDLKDSRLLLERAFRGDASALILANTMTNRLASFQSPEIDTQLVEIQKVANVVYAQFFITLHNAKMNNKAIPLVFVREEYLIVTDQDSATVIHVFVPTTDPAPRGAVYSQIQEWFSGLAILVK
jgi:hypothetical protein